MKIRHDTEECARRGRILTDDGIVISGGDVGDSDFDTPKEDGEVLSKRVLYTTYEEVDRTIIKQWMLTEIQCTVRRKYNPPNRVRDLLGGILCRPTTNQRSVYPLCHIILNLDGHTK